MAISSAGPHDCLNRLSQTATFSGKVTDQNTGVGFPDVAVVAVGSGETLSIITAQAIESGVSHNLPVEDLRKVPGVPWLSQLTVMLPSDLVVPGELTVSVTAREKTSNAATIRVQ